MKGYTGHGLDPYGGMAAAILYASGQYVTPNQREGWRSQAGPHVPGVATPPAPGPAPAGPGPGPPSAARPRPPAPNEAAPAPAAAAAAAPATGARAASARGRTPGGGGGGGGAASAPPPPPQAPNSRIRCLCGDHTDRGKPMVQCSVPGCGVWQHAACVQGAAWCRDPPPFACEACRLADADPFWVAAAPADCPGLAASTAYDASPLTRRGAPPLLPPGADQHSVIVAADRSLFLSPATAAALAAAPDRLRLQLACMGLGDGPTWPGTAASGAGAGGVPGRVHWPRFADVRVNNAALPPATRRHPHDPLTARGRDPAVDVPPGLLRAGANRVYVGGVELMGRPFALVARVVAARPLAALAASPPAAEPLAAALARVRACVAGDDPDLIVESAPLSLRCPLSGGRFATPIRLAGPGGGLVAFDWAAFLEVGSRSRRWVCPHSLRPAPLRALVGDAYIAAVLAALAGRPDVMEVEVGTDGRWRAGPGEAWRSVLEAEGGGGGAGGGDGGAAAPAAGPCPPVVAVSPACPPLAAGVKAEAAAGPPPPPPAAQAPPPPPPGRGGSGRGRPPPADVILIVSSDSDSDAEEDVPLAARGAARGAPTRRLDTGGGGPGAATAAAPPAPTGPPAPPPVRPAPIRVALPTRTRPAVDAAAAAAATAAEARGRQGAVTASLLSTFVAALSAAASPDREATVAAAAAGLVAAGTATPRGAATLAGQAFEAAEATLRARRRGGSGSGGGSGGPGRPASAPTPPAEREAAAAAAAAARARLATDAAARARVATMAVGAAAARLPGGGGGQG